MTERETRATIVRQVARGERPLDDLQPVGITLQFDGNQLTERNTHQPTVSVSFRDVAHGLLALHEEPERLRRLAFALHGGGFVTLPDDDAPEHEFIMGGLWDAAVYESFSDTTIDKLCKIAAGQ
jgi:hypothetical protein